MKKSIKKLMFFWGICSAGIVLASTLHMERVYAVESDVETSDAGVCGMNARWNLTSDGVLRISGSGAMTEYASDNLPPWHERKDEILSIIVEEGITEVGGYAFYECSAVREVTLPDSMIRLRSFCFARCSSLTSFTVPPNLDSLYSTSFLECTSLERFVADNLSGGFKVYDDCLYQSDMSILLCCPPAKSSIDIYAGTKKINDYAFVDCAKLTSIIIPDSVTEIGYGVFQSCKGLTEITVPASVASMGQHEFANCTSLRKAVVNAQIRELPEYCFDRCTALREIVLPAGLTRIGGHAFESCGFTEINIPDTVREIGGQAFMMCADLEAIRLPKNLTAVSEYMLAYCVSLKSVEFSNQITSIDTFAFACDLQLTEIILPESVKRLGSYCFYYCSGLNKVSIPPSVTEIADNAFLNGNANMVIQCAYGSAAHQYAKEKNFTSEIIDLKEIQVAATDYSGIYDESEHTISLDVQGPEEYQIYYSSSELTEENYTSGSTESLVRVLAGAKKVYYYVTAPGYRPASGSANIYIRPRVSASGKEVAYDGQAYTASISAGGGATLYYSADKVLSYENYRDGITGIPAFTEAGSYTVYYVAVPDSSASAAACTAGSISIRINPVLPSLSFSSAVVEKNVGDAIFRNELKTNSGGKATYSSTNPKVAQVDAATGDITILQAGVCVIRVDLAASGNYMEASADFVLNVSDPGAGSGGGENSAIPVTNPASFTGQTPTISVKTAGANKIRVSWKKIIGAQKYYVYYATSSKGTYRLAKTLSSSKTSYAMGKLKKNRTYYFKVKCSGVFGGETIYTKESKIALKKAVGAPPRPSLRGMVSGNSLKLSWKRQKGVKKIVVYRRTNKGAFKSIKKLSPEKTSYRVSLKSLDIQNRYSFCIKTYYVKDGVKIWSNSSKPVNLKY